MFLSVLPISLIDLTFRRRKRHMEFLLDRGHSCNNRRYQCRVWVLIRAMMVIGAEKIWIGNCSVDLCLRASGFDIVGRCFKYGFYQAFSKNEERALPSFVIIVFDIRVTRNGFALFADEKLWWKIEWVNLNFQDSPTMVLCWLYGSDNRIQSEGDGTFKPFFIEKFPKNSDWLILQGQCMIWRMKSLPTETQWKRGNVPISIRTKSGLFKRM